ncbi:hypothetical protein ABZ816_42435 [Actinosynnema sp. NPDC047251]|uniref:Secreted protein n=1 Tax=Saccharothrix espanaensis (strain ATCC 51144 / DSM 44229 / JCM 9112 / NBRC 15066 / NRRL 15764) TaxID=1179773 RepID=K0K7N5_SACES|nr:hypothetical protein [Saccharothrix espanaensis]CCH32613.1 hypothetical protein BN6_53500 [Saccharothrix espanaensis DSM 44229]
MPSRRWIAAALVVLALGAAGCAGTPTADDRPVEPPAKVESISGKDVKRVTLTERAHQRVGVETVEIATGASGLVVPYAAVIYSADGGTWVFVETGSRSYAREKVVVENVGGDKGTEAYLSAGPPVGTKVVRTGVVELYGAELGVGK